MAKQETGIGDLVNNLFHVRQRPGGDKYTNQEVAAAIGVESSYISKLRKGTVPNPGRDTLKKLCVFFQVPASYFFPELDQQAGAAANSPDEQLRLALRAAGLSREAEVYVEQLVELLRRSGHQERG